MQRYQRNAPYSKYFVNGEPNNCFAKSVDLIDSQVASGPLVLWFSNTHPYWKISSYNTATPSEGYP